MDVGEVNVALARFLPGGLLLQDLHPSAPGWKHVFEPFIRQSAGLGKAPPEAQRRRPVRAFLRPCGHRRRGGGIAGLQAALAAGRAGVRCSCANKRPIGAGARRSMADRDGAPAEAWVAAAVAELEAMENVHLRPRTMGAGVYDHGYVLAYERVSDHDPEDGVPRHRLWRIRTRQVITATGAIERPLALPGTTNPG
jgi:sarcosine oxidase subunit alpha